MHGAATAISAWPHLLDGRDQAGCPVRDDQPRAAQASSCEIAAQVEPVLARLPLAEADRQQDPLAAEVIAPGHQYPPCRRSVGSASTRRPDTAPADQRQPGSWRRTRRSGRAARDTAGWRCSWTGGRAPLRHQVLDIAIGQAAHVGTDDQRFQRSGLHAQTAHHSQCDCSPRPAVARSRQCARRWGDRLTPAALDTQDSCYADMLGLMQQLGAVPAPQVQGGSR